jgi:hypothetical protein
MSDESVKKTSFIAIASLLCAIGAIISVLLMGWMDNLVIYSIYMSHIGGILGVMAVVLIIIRHKVLKGYTYAILAIILVAPILILDYGVRGAVKIRLQHKKEWSGLYNLELLGRELAQYAKDNNDCLPVAEKWCDLLMANDPNLPKDKFKYDSSKEGVYNYAFNKVFSGAQLKNIPYNAVLVFESMGKWNLSGTEELFRKTPKKRQYVYIYTKDAEKGFTTPREVNIKESDYKEVLWKALNK